MTQIKIQIKQNYIKNNMNTYLPANNNPPVPTREEFHRQYAGSICPPDFSTEYPSSHITDRIARSLQLYREKRTELPCTNEKCFSGSPHD